MRIFLGWDRNEMGTLIALARVGWCSRVNGLNRLGWFGWFGHTHQYSSESILRVDITARWVVTPSCQLVAARDECGQYPPTVGFAPKSIPLQGFQTECSNSLAGNLAKGARSRATEERDGLSLLGDEGTLSERRIRVALDLVQRPA
jgi:hypothetical protein